MNKNKIKIPKELKLFVMAFSIGLIITLGIFTSQILLNYKILDYYILVLLFSAMLGLLITSIFTIKEFKEKIQN